jgi:hypothetical protein
MQAVIESNSGCYSSRRQSEPTLQKLAPSDVIESFIDIFE